MYEYDEQFYKYINQGSARSANIVVPALLDLLPQSVESVLDVGCGAGAWLAVWKEHGCRVKGLDGDYVDRNLLLIEANEFMPQDLQSGFDLREKFDVAQCLEVAEHLPEPLSATLVGALCRHADIVLFSAAAPGQGGENHINEQTYGYWRDMFAANGYQMYDPLRGELVSRTEVLPWYRYNTFVYLNIERLPETHAALASYKIDRATHPKDVSPILYQVRKAVIRLLPVRLKTMLAIAKKKVANLLIRFK
ncbi:MAG: class I SAM-dependent methyltransferase [Pseudomonadales bacterium]